MDRRDPVPAGRPALALATCFGIGHIPWAPGTFGSIPGLLLYAGAYRQGGTVAALATAVALFLAGVWAASRAERHFGGKDPGKVVIDEVVGQMAALLFLTPTLAVVAVGFVLFRVFDILKPFPIRRFELLSGGSGIMADDVMAGLYANLALQALVRALSGLDELIERGNHAHERLERHRSLSRRSRQGGGQHRQL